MNILQKLAEAVQTRRNWRDTLKPGLVISQLGSREWYVSIVRYPADAPRVVEVNAKGATLDAAALSCALAYVVKLERVFVLDREIKGGASFERAVAKALL